MLNRLVAGVLVSVFFGVAHADTIRLSEPVETSVNSETFGVALDESLPLVELSELLQKPSHYTDNDFRLKTRIAKVCQKKGCFFIAQQGDAVIRVSFKDYGFFIPTDSANKTVVLAGRLVRKQVTQEQVEHYQSDMDSAEQGLVAGETYEIVAESIRIPITAPAS